MAVATPWPAVYDRLYDVAVREADREDKLNDGIRVDQFLADRLRTASGDELSLAPNCFEQVRSRFQSDLRDVRIQCGAIVDSIAHDLGASAFCVGRKIFLTRELVFGNSMALLFSAVCHEMKHIANFSLPQAIRCWERPGHEKLTSEACDYFGDELKALAKLKTLHVKSFEHVKEQLVINCTNMDVRKRVFHPIDTADYILGGIFGVRTFAIGEGPRHGEGKNYRTDSIEDNVALNKAAQQSELEKAVRNFADDYASNWNLDDVLPTINLPVPFLGKAAILEKEWIKHLALALHTAQDRAAHREGRMGYGHNDPRTVKWERHATKWEPDEPTICDHIDPIKHLDNSWWRCNCAAFNVGYNNSCDVIYDFLNSVNQIHNLGLVIKGRKRRSEVCNGIGHTGRLHTSRLHKGRLHKGRRQSETHGCVFGRRPGPIGKD